MRRIAVLDAPSNLGLRPPTATSVPGCAKAPGALRDAGLLRRLNARDAGCLTPPRYDPGEWRPGDGVAHAREIGVYSRRLADRIGTIIDQGEFPVILGGDCSIVLGSAVAMNRLGESIGGRIGLIFVDGHSDFRHPGNASYVGAAAGEDLALVTGRGQANLTALEGRRPYYRDIDVVVMGIRAQDEYRLDLQAAGIVTRPVPALRAEGAARSAQWAQEQLVDCAGYWVHLDVDVLDPAVMPAVDAPEPGGIAFPELEILLSGLVGSPHCLGVEITVFDPDYDPDGAYAEEITAALVAGLQSAHAVDLRPDLVAAREDLLDPEAPGVLATPTPPRKPQAAPHPEPLATEPLVAAVAEPVAADEPPVADEPLSVAEPFVVAVAEPIADDEELAVAEPVAVAEPLTVDEPAGVADATDAFDALDAPDAHVVSEVPVTFADTTDDPAPEDEPPAADEPEHAAASEIVEDPAPAAGDTQEVPEPLSAGDPAPEMVEMSIAEPEPEPEPDPDPEPEPEPEQPELVPALVAAEGDERAGQGGHAGRDGHAGPDELAGQDEHAGHDGYVGDDCPPGDDSDAGHDESLRPLGTLPLLDSEPLPATMPGMLRPRRNEEFTLPVQRPAFELGHPEEPADIT